MQVGAKRVPFRAARGRALHGLSQAWIGFQSVSSSVVDPGIELRLPSCMTSLHQFSLLAVSRGTRRGACTDGQYRTGYYPTEEYR